MSGNKSFQLNLGDREFTLPKKKRIIVGSSDSADLQIKSSTVDALHCLIEFLDDEIKVYSLNNKSKVKVNDEEIVAGSLSINDKISIGKYEFTLFQRDLPEPGPALDNSYKTKKLPSKPDEQKTSYNDNYPLSKDASFEFSEYIFEDEGIIYPIFKYEINKRAAEVIILFNDKIYSVDFIPMKDGKYNLVGKTGGPDYQVELPYLGINEKVPFIEIKGGEIFLNDIPSFKHITYADNNLNSNLLGKEDIHFFHNGNISIFVRGDEAPPKVKTAPILRRDNEFKKYLLFFVLLMGIFISALSFYEIDPELEKQKVPERLAKILYKPKQLRVSKKKNQVVKKTQKKTTQKAPKVTTVDKKVAKKQATTKKVGSKNAKSTKIAKKAPPKKGPKNNKQVVKKSSSKKATTKVTKKAANKNRSAKRVAKSRGKVEVYKSVDFSSSLSSLMAKSGSLASATTTLGRKESIADGTDVSIDDSAQIETANLSSKTGSLSGSTSGTVESSKGTSGLVQRKQVYIAGMPYREVILGSIDRNDIMRILLENVPQFRHCYQRVLDTGDKSVSGVLMLNFVIGPVGNVTFATSKPTNKQMPASVSRCVVSHLKTIRFPTPKGGGQVSVNTPLNLYGRGQ